MTSVYILHGVADRDRTELVCMMFPNMQEVCEFIACLPGTYRVAEYQGIDYDAIEYVNTEVLS